MTLGSNIGTTTTSLLASLAAGGDHFKEVHQDFMFNWKFFWAKQLKVLTHEVVREFNTEDRYTYNIFAYLLFPHI